MRSKHRAEPPPPHRGLGLPSILTRARRPARSLVSHLGVATLAAVMILMTRSGPTPAPSHGLALGESPHEQEVPPGPSEMSVDLRGGTPSPDARSELRVFTPDDRVSVVVRHSGRRSDEARLLVHVQPLAGASASSAVSPEIYLGLDPRRVAWQGQALHYEGTVEELWPLATAPWRLTFMISDPRECAGPPMHVCASADAWLIVQRPELAPPSPQLR